MQIVLVCLSDKVLNIVCFCMGLLFFQADTPANVCHLRKSIGPMLFYLFSGFPATEWLLRYLPQEQIAAQYLHEQKPDGQ